MWIVLLGFFCVCFMFCVFFSDTPFISAIKLMIFLSGVIVMIACFYFLGVLFFENLKGNDVPEEPEVMQYSGSLAHNQCYDYTLKQLEDKYLLDSDMVNIDKIITNSEIYLECMGQ